MKKFIILIILVLFNTSCITNHVVQNNDKSYFILNKKCTPIQLQIKEPPDINTELVKNARSYEDKSILLANYVLLLKKHNLLLEQQLKEYSNSVEKCFN